jgi:chemotaxis protein MotB
MIGLLFIFIILLMAFALNFRTAEEQAQQTMERLLAEKQDLVIEKERVTGDRQHIADERDRLARQRDRLKAQRDELSRFTSYLLHNDQIRREMLATVQDLLLERQVEVSLDAENGVLRLPEGLLFDTAEAVLRPEGARALRELAAVLARTLPCYSEAPGVQQADCPIAPKPLLEAVLIEGHTDDRPMANTSRFRDNWELAGARAVNTYKALIRYQPSLDFLQNGRGEALLGVSAYEARRPVVEPASTDEARRLNRRIDLRFLIAAPSSEEVSAIESRLEVHDAEP